MLFFIAGQNKYFSFSSYSFCANFNTVKHGCTCVCVVHVDVYLRRSDVTIEKHSSLSSIVVVALVEGWRGQAPAAVCPVEQKWEEGEIEDKACNQTETVNGALCRSSLSVTSAAATVLLLFSFPLSFCISVHLATVLVVVIVVLVLWPTAKVKNTQSCW